MLVPNQKIPFWLSSTTPALQFDASLAAVMSSSGSGDFISCAHVGSAVVRWFCFFVS
jgi:hypothetical protein